MTEARGVDAGRGGGSGDGEAVDTSHHSDIDWIAAERSPEFQELIKRKRAFVLPATIFFLAWYFGFIMLAGYAPDFMGEEFLTTALTVGYVLALTQFVMVWVLAAWYLRKPTVSSTRSPSERRRAWRRRPGRARQPSDASSATRSTGRAGDEEVTALDDLHRSRRQRDWPWRSSRGRRRVTWWSPTSPRSASRRPPTSGPPGRGLTGRQNGFAIAGDYMSAAIVPRHRRPDLPVRLRRLPVLRRLPRGLPHRAVPARRADAQLGQVHDRRRAVVPDERSPPARRRRSARCPWSGFYLIAQMVGAGVLIQALVGIDFALSVLLTGTFMIIYIVAGGMLATSWVQIIKAVLLMTATIVLSLFVLGEGGLEPDRPVHRGARRVARGPGLPGARACSCRARSTRSRSAWRWCSARPGCRTS